MDTKITMTLMEGVIRRNITGSFETIRVLLWYLPYNISSCGRSSYWQKIKANFDNDKSLKVEMAEARVTGTIFVWPAWSNCVHKHRYEDRLHLVWCINLYGKNATWRSARFEAITHANMTRLHSWCTRC